MKGFVNSTSQVSKIFVGQLFVFVSRVAEADKNCNIEGSFPSKVDLYEVAEDESLLFLNGEFISRLLAFC